MEKVFSRTLLAVYLLVLIWLVLFKFSFDISAVLFDHQTRSLNLVPFIGASHGSLREMIDNIIVFIPFGLLLSVTLKQTSLWRKLSIIFIFSLAAEIIQFVLAIGATDITDLITNTLGGLLGLVIYDLCKKIISDKHLDRFIVVVGAILLISVVLVRVLLLRVRY